jgi:hypothetical protein
LAPDKLPTRDHWAIRLARILKRYHHAPMGAAIVVGAVGELAISFTR